MASGETASSERRVAVVGGGLAGLSAAWELRRGGVSVVLLEREDRAGGRARSESHEGFTLEPLSPLLSTADREVLAWIAELGVADDLLPLRPVVVSQVHGSRVRDFDPRHLWDYARIPGLRPHQGLRLVRLPRLLRRYAARLDPDFPERGAPLDDRSLADFGRLYFGRSVLERWMAPRLTSRSLGDEYQTSRVHFLVDLKRLERARAGLVRGALTELTDAAAGRLPILTGANVQRVKARPDGSCQIAYSRDDHDRLVEADAVVVATPAAEARRIAQPVLGTGEREILERVRYAPAVSVAVATCRPPAAHPTEIRVPHAEGSPLETVLLEPGLPGGRVPDGYGCLTLRATGAYGQRALELPDETIAKELLDALERFKPDARNAVEFTRVMRLPQALPRFDVGHYRALARLARSEDERCAEGPRVRLAGDYRMDPSWWGAFASGRRAARALLAELGRAAR